MAFPLNTVAQDVRYALRQLRRSPGFAITAIVTIALGIGANTAIFTLAHAILLRELPVTDPKSLYRIGDTDDCCINGGMPENQRYSIFSTEAYEHLRDSTTADFDQLAAMTAGGGNGPGLARRSGTNDAPKSVRGSYISGNYFTLFGLQPALGRLLTPQDDRDGAPPVAVMSYSTWVSEYQSDPSVVGASFLLDNRPITIIGITPASFYGDRVRDRTPDFYLPIATEPVMDNMKVAHDPHLGWLYIIGRIKPGVRLPVLQQKVNGILRGYEATQKDYSSDEGRKELPKIHATIIPAGSGIQQGGQITKGLRILMGIAGLVLLIACANIANLLLARGTTRRAETSVRIALGAARSRIVRQTLTESIVLALIGGVLGVLLAFAGARAMLALAFPESHNLPISANPSLPVLLFTLGVSVLTGMLFGVVPAWSTTRSEPAEALRGLNRSSRDRSSLPQRTLVVLQAMLSLVLITVAALLTRSLTNLQHQNFGLETHNRLVLHMDPAATGYTNDRMPGLMRQLGDRIRAIPGTEKVAFANYSPLEGNNWGEGIFVEGKPDPRLGDNIGASWVRISPGFFETIGQRVLRGRDYTEADRKDTPLVSIVNETFVHKFFPNEDPLGKRFGIEKHKFLYTIVGVVADAKYQDPASEVNPMFFRSMLQPNPNADPKDMGETYSLAPHAILIRTTEAQQGYEAQLRRAFKEVDSNLAITDLRTLDSQVADQLNNQRMVARLTATFGILALVLASIGLYGVTAYAVAQRVPEIGLRMALGSDRRRILTMVLRGAMTQTLIGLALGIPAALLAGHYLQSQLFGIQGHDALTLAAACTILALSALTAAAIPARRASAIEPMQALRSE